MAAATICRDFESKKIKPVNASTLPWNANVGREEIPGETGKFGLGV